MNLKPIIFLAFANDREDNVRYLRNLNKELHEIEEALRPIKDQFEVIHYEGITLKVLFDRFQEHKDRIAIFHYGGHADGYQLLLETTQGNNQTAYGKGLINFLATFKDSLKLVFFNGCTTENLAQDLAAAGLPAVIGTESTIKDEVATRLAIRFYNGLANDHSIENAWKQAVGEIEASYNTEAGTRGLYRKGVEKEPTEVPWKMYCTDEKNLDWKLEKVGNKNYNVEIGRQNIKININMDLISLQSLISGAFGNPIIQSIGGEAVKAVIASITNDMYAKIKALLIKENPKIETAVKKVEENPKDLEFQKEFDEYLITALKNSELKQSLQEIFEKIPNVEILEDKVFRIKLKLLQLLDDTEFAAFFQEIRDNEDLLSFSKTERSTFEKEFKNDRNLRADLFAERLRVFTKGIRKK